MGAVTLRVGNLDAMIAYYRDAVTLELQSHDGPVAVLGRGTTPIVILQHAPELAAPEPRSAGLFHTAILFDTQAQLAAAVYSVGTRHPGSFTGSADHLVSQAFYFTDPEGNGIELYWDRDRSAWSWTHGQVEMAHRRRPRRARRTDVPLRRADPPRRPDPQLRRPLGEPDHRPHGVGASRPAPSWPVPVEFDRHTRQTRPEVARSANRCRGVAAFPGRRESPFTPR